MMARRRLGRTGFHASIISLGTVEIGMEYGLAARGESRAVPDVDAIRLLERALDLGVNLIDTARSYGRSESLMGRALARRRDEFFLASKTSAYENEAIPADERRRLIIASVESSLRELRTPVIDLMQLHSASARAFELDEIPDTLDELRHRGLIRFAGASVYGECAALLAIESGRYDSIQIACSALDRRAEPVVLPRARTADVGVIARSVLLQGVLTHRSRDLPVHLAPLREAAARIEALDPAPLAEIAYRYVLGQPFELTALAGARTVGELEAAVRYAGEGPLAQSVIDGIRTVEVEPLDLLHPGTWGI